MRLDGARKVKEFADHCIQPIDLNKDDLRVRSGQHVACLLRHLRPKADGRQGVTEFMGDAGCKLSNGRQAFLVRQLGLEGPFASNLLLEFLGHVINPG